MAITLAEVAKHAGVSTMTVSNVLTGKTHKVSAATAHRVMEAVAATGYVVNASARSLSAKSSRIVAIVITSDSPILKGAHDAALVGRLVEGLQAHGYTAMVVASHDVRTTINSLQSWNVDGAVFLGTLARDIEAIHEHHRVPLLFSDNYLERDGILTVRTDDYGGGFLAGEYLIDKGHRDNVLFLGPMRGSIGVVDERMRGFRDAYRTHGLPEPVAPQITDDASLSSGIAIAEAVMALVPQPSAVFCSADDLAVGLIRGLTRLGVSIPGDLSIVGFDGFMIGEAVTPALTTIGQDLEAKATRIISLLINAIRTEAQPDEHVLDTLPVTLIERESVTIAPR